jgi:Flp pilus assembly protein TadD
VPSERAPAEDESLLARALEALDAGETARACALGEAAAAVAPMNPEPRRFLGRCYMRIGERQRARESYSVYLRLSPGAPDAAFVRLILSKP